MPKSLRDRLAERAKTLGLRMPQVQLLLAQERFLARVATADRDQKLVWKGGSLVLRQYTALKIPRFTSDLDFLARGIAFEEAEELLMAAMKADLKDEFQFSKATKSEMERDTPYGGSRFEISWSFQKKPQSEPLRIDLCSGDDVDPRKVDLQEIYLLEDESDGLSISVYPAEFIFAEKLETLVRFGTGNTRLKDFIDLWNFTQLAGEKFSAEKCAKAIERCFTRRGTVMAPNRWEKILGDHEFQEIMEEARQRNFPNLPVPEVPTMFKEIAAYVEKLKLARKQSSKSINQ